MFPVTHRKRRGEKKKWWKNKKKSCNAKVLRNDGMRKVGERKSLEQEEEFNQASRKEMQEKRNLIDNCAISEQVISPHTMNSELERNANQGYKSIPSPHPLSNPASSSSSSSVSNLHHLSLHSSSRKHSLMREINRHYDGLIGEFDVKMSTNEEVGRKMKEIFHEKNEVGEREKKERKENERSESMEGEEKSDQMEAAGSSSFGSGEKSSVLNPDTVSNVSSSTFQTTITARQSKTFFSPPHQPFDPDGNSFNPQTDTHNFSSSSSTTIFDNQTPVLDSIVHEFNNTSTVEETGIEGEGRNRKNESEGEKRRSKDMKEEEENGKKRSEGEGREEKRQPQSTPPPLLEVAPGPGADAATVESEKTGEEISIGVPKSLPSLSPQPHSFVSSNSSTQTQQHLHIIEMTTAPVIPPTSGHHNSMTKNPLTSLTGHSPAPVSSVSTQPRLSSAKFYSNATICGSELNSVKVSAITPGGLPSLANDALNPALDGDGDDVVTLPMHPCPDGVSMSGDRISTDRIATWGPNSNGFLLTRTGAPASTVSAQIFKLKRFLTTLHHFAIGISPSTGQHVHELIHALVSSRITIEDFHQRIPRVTSYPLRPYVIPFLRLHLPILQGELRRFYSQSQTRSQSSSLSSSQSQDTAGNHQEGINRSVISVNSLNKNSHLRQGSSNLQTSNFSDFIRSHESLFLQSVIPKPQSVINQQKLVSFPKLIRGNESIQIEKKYQSGDIVQIGNNIYVGANKNPNLIAAELINHETNNVDPIKLQVEKLVGEYIQQRPSTNHQSPSDIISRSYQSNQAPKLIGRVSSFNNEPRVVRELVGTPQVSNQQLNNQQQPPLKYHQAINQRLIDNQQSISNQGLNKNQQIISDRQLIAMGIKEGSGEGVKRKLSSPVESRKENEKIDQNTKSDHLRVSSGPRKFIPNHSPNQAKINMNQLTRLVNQQPSSTIHYLPNNNGPIAHLDCMNSGLINTQTSNTENNAKRIKVNENLNQDSPNGRTTNGQLTNGQVNGQSSQSASSDPNEPETDHEWDNIYVMLNCILGMVEKTKQALFILESRKIRQRNEADHGSKGLSGNGTGSLTTGCEKLVSSTLAAGTGFNGIVNQQQFNNWNGIMIQEQGQQRSSRPSLSPLSAPFPSSNIQNSTSSGSSLLTNKVSSTLTLNNGLPTSCSSSLGAATGGAEILGATALVTSSSSSSSSSATSPRSASSWPRIVSYGSAAGMTSGSFASLSLNGSSTTVTRQQGSPSNGSGNRSFTGSSSFAPSNNQPSLASIHNAFIASQCLTNDQGSLVMNKNPGTSAFSSLSTFPSPAVIEEFKRRTAIDALESAKVEANEIIVEERMKMERLILEAKRKATEELMTSLNRQEDRSENCWNCGRIASDTCSGCNQARYCGSFCQHKHWDIHHKTCGKISGRQSKSPSNISI